MLCSVATAMTLATTVYTTHVLGVSASSTSNELQKLLHEKDLALHRIEGKVVLLQEKVKDVDKVLEETAKKTFARTTASTPTNLTSASGGHSSVSSQNEVFINAVL